MYSFLFSIFKLLIYLFIKMDIINDIYKFSTTSIIQKKSHYITLYYSE